MNQMLQPLSVSSYRGFAANDSERLQCFHPGITSCCGDTLDGKEMYATKRICTCVSFMKKKMKASAVHDGATKDP